jgi:hypothetical protein
MSRLPFKGGRRTNCHRRGNGLVWLKQGALAWVVLFCGFLAGASAGSLGMVLCWRLNGDRGGDVERHQAMLTDQAGDQVSGEQQDWKLQCFGGFRGNLVPLAIDFHGSGFQAYPDRGITEVDGFRADHGEGCVQGVRIQLEQIADFYRDFAVLIAEGQTPSLRMTALRYRQFHIFQNQFTSIVEFSCLRDAPIVLKNTLFSSISYPTTTVLGSLADAGRAAHGLKCAAGVYLESAPAVRRPSHSPMLKDGPYVRWRDRPAFRSVGTQREPLSAHFSTRTAPTLAANTKEAA